MLVGNEAHRYLLDVDYSKWMNLQNKKFDSYFLTMSVLDFKEFLIEAEALLKHEDEKNSHNNIKVKIRSALEVLASSKLINFMILYLFI